MRKFIFDVVRFTRFLLKRVKGCVELYSDSEIYSRSTIKFV